MKLEDHIGNLFALAPSHPDKGVKKNFSNFMKRFAKAAVDEIKENPEAVKAVLEKLVEKLEDKPEEKEDGKPVEVEVQNTEIEDVPETPRIRKR